MEYASKSRTTEVGDDELGSYAETDMSFGAKNPGGVKGSFERRMLLGDGASFKRCPDASGTVRGEYKRRQRESTTVDLPGAGKGSYYIDSTAEARLEAHVGDDAYAKDYEYKGTIAIEIGGRDANGRHVPTRVFRISFSQSGVSPHGWKSPFAAGSTARAEGWGPRGRVSGKELDLVVNAWSLGDLLLQEGARNRLREVETLWRGGRCVEVDAGPDGRQVRTGGAINVQAVARSKVDGQPVQPARLTPSVCTKFYEGGAVSPGAAGSPGVFTYRDPARAWDFRKNDWDPPCLGFEAVSRRGIGKGFTTFRVVGEPIPLFTVKVDYTVVNDCGPSPSVTLDDATFTGALTKRDPDSERLSAGTGLANGTLTNSDCTNSTTSSRTNRPMQFFAQYTTDGSGNIAVNYLTPSVLRWSNLALLVPGRNGVYTLRQDGEPDGAGAAVHHEWVVTISNLRRSTD